MEKIIFTLAFSIILAISFLVFPSTVTAGRKVIGNWIDSSLYVGATYKIYIEDGKTYLSRKFKDGSGGVLELIKDIKHIGKAAYREINDKDGDYYVINKRGYLEIRDGMGLIVTLELAK